MLALTRCSPFVAKSHALLYALEHVLLHSDVFEDMEVNIRTDAMSVLSSLTNLIPVDPLLFQLQMYMQPCLKRNVRLTLSWVPGHYSAYGNELADVYAKESRDELDVNTTSLSLMEAKSILKSTAKEQGKKYWVASEKGSATRRFFDTFLQLALVSKLSLTAPTVQFLSGHHRLKSFLFHKYNLGDSPMCDCREEEEIIDHYLFRCNKYINIRQEWEGSFLTSCHDFGCTEENLRQLDKYVTLTRRFV